MPTPKRGARLGGSAKNQKHILSNLAASLFEHDAIKTTDAKAKMLRPYVEKLITKAKVGDLAARREVAKKITNKDAVYRLFHEIAPQMANREGGYTRIVKLENRRGDDAPMSQISLVLEETASAEATRATRAAASRKAEEAKAAEAEETEAEESTEATDAEVEADVEAEAGAEVDAEAAETEADDAEAEDVAK